MPNLYVVCWIAWIVEFFVIELTALFTGHERYTLSGLVWHTEGLGTGWSFARYFVAAFCVWLTLHMTFGWFK